MSGGVKSLTTIRDNHKLMAAIQAFSEKRNFLDEDLRHEYKKEGFEIVKEKIARVGRGPYPEDLFTEKQLTFLKNYLIEYEKTLEPESRISGNKAAYTKLVEDLLKNEDVYSGYRDEMLKKFLNYKIIEERIKSKSAAQVITISEGIFPLAEMISLEYAGIKFVSLDAKRPTAIKEVVIKKLTEQNKYLPKSSDAQYIPFDVLNGNMSLILTDSNIDKNKASVLNMGSIKAEFTGGFVGKLMAISKEFSLAFPKASSVLHNFIKIEKAKNGRVINDGVKKIEQKAVFAGIKLSNNEKFEMAVVINESIEEMIVERPLVAAGLAGKVKGNPGKQIKLELV